MKPTMTRGTRKKMIWPKIWRRETTTSMTCFREPSAFSPMYRPSRAPMMMPPNSLRIREKSPTLAAILHLRGVKIRKP